MTEPAQMTPPPFAVGARPGSRLARLAARPALISPLLAAVIFTVFCPALRCQFVNLDDPLYVTSNLHVQSGLTADGLAWAFHTGQAGNWHPLTWISHMLDCQLYGLSPEGHHLTSLLFHALNSVLLFVLLRRLTGALWRSAFVAALFALHPLHVESVAWIAERKDVLSACFFMLTLWAYGCYAEKSVVSGQWSVVSRHPSEAPAADQGPRTTDYGLRARHPASRFYVLALCLFALGLMSKPMLVTLPFLLLLLDYWPLRRLQLFALKPQPSTPPPPSTFAHLVLEKWPFFLLSAASCIVTFIMQRQGGAVQPLAVMSTGARLENALVACARYLGKTLWPAGLATPYPHPGHWPLPAVALAAVLLAALTLGALWLVRKCPFAAVGWFWFLGMLVPVLGIVQVGDQSMADRYTYLPLIGLFIAVAWGLDAAFARWRLPKAALLVAGLVLVSCSAQTRAQLSYWQNSETLFRHATAVTKNNWLAYYNLACYLDGQKRTDEALANYRRTVEAQPKFADAWNNLGYVFYERMQYAEALPYLEKALSLKPSSLALRDGFANSLRELGRTDEAIEQYRLILQQKPDDFTVLNDLGNALARKGQFAEAMQEYEASLRAKPDQATAHYGLAGALARTGRPDEAIGHYRLALQRNPDFAVAHNDLGFVLARKGDLDGAIAQFREAVRCKPDDPAALCNLGRTLAGRQRFDEAVPLYVQALSVAPTNADAHAGLGLALAALGRMDEAVGHFQEAVRLRPDNANAHFNLGRGLAAQGKSDEAIRQLTEALRLKPDFAPARQELQALTGQKTP
jgi:protein O-mannosyl-transferase